MRKENPQDVRVTRSITFAVSIIGIAVSAFGVLTQMKLANIQSMLKCTFPAK
jgi:hypothetical protein